MVLSGRKTFLITGFIIILVGAALIAGGILYRNSVERKKSEWPHIQAVVVGNNRKDEEDDGYRETSYRAIVEYVVDGKVYKAAESNSSNVKPINGTTREIAYNPENPAEHVFISENQNLIMIILCVGGATFVFAGFLTLVTYAKKR